MRACAETSSPGTLGTDASSSIHTGQRSRAKNLSGEACVVLQEPAAFTPLRMGNMGLKRTAGGQCCAGSGLRSIPTQYGQRRDERYRPGPPAARVATSTSDWDFFFNRGTLWEVWLPRRRRGSDGEDGDADVSSAAVHRERAAMTESRIAHTGPPHTPSPSSPSASSPDARAYTHTPRAPRDRRPA